MPGKDLRQAFAAFVQQLKDRLQSLIADVTAVETSTYGVEAPHLEDIAAAVDIETPANAASSTVQRRGYTRVSLHCDLQGCTETGRQDDVEESVRPIHEEAVEQTLAGRETLLEVSRETLERLRG